MLRVKFQDHRSFSSGEEYFKGFFTIYGHGSHLVHVTHNNFYIHVFVSYLPNESPYKIDFDWQAVSEEMIEISGHKHVYSPSTGTP